MEHSARNAGIAAKLLLIGKWAFLAGIAFLIIRKNEYPWPIKRASDILFAFSAFSTLWFIYFKKAWGGFKNPPMRVLGRAGGMLILGIAIAAMSAYVIDGTTLTAEGIAEIARFAEVFVIATLFGFFYYVDSSFLKKTALAQLSTVLYLGAFLIPRNFVVFYDEFVYRFQFFENWASNIGYYLVVTLTLAAGFLFYTKRRLHRIILYVIGIGFSGILLWTQSRAAWLGAAIALVVLVFFWAERHAKKMAAGWLIILSMPFIGFFLLPPSIQNTVLVRIFPRTAVNIDRIDAAPLETIQTIVGGTKTADILPRETSNRTRLWQIYADKIATRPLGLGPNAEAVDIGAGKQGPHNIFLQLFAFAGPLGLFGFLYLAAHGLKNAFHAIKAVPAGSGAQLWPVYVFASLMGLLVASFFDNTQTFRLLWLMIGMGIFIQASGGSFDTTSHTPEWTPRA